MKQGKYIFFSISLLVTSYITMACVCNIPPISTQQLTQFDNIAVVKIKTLSPFNSTDKLFGLSQLAVIEPLEIFKGKKINELVISGVNTSCDLGVKEGDTWVIFTRQFDGKPSIAACSYNTPLFRLINGPYANFYFQSGFSTLEFLRNTYYKLPVTGTFSKSWLNKKTAVTISLKNGKIQGDKIWYDADGKKIWSRQYNQGKQDGNADIWYITGQLHSEKKYIADSLQGTSYVYYANGIKMQQENYENNKLEGLRLKWDEFNNLTYKAFYKNGLQIDTAYLWYNIDTSMIAAHLDKMFSSLPVDTHYNWQQRRQLQSVIIHDKEGNFQRSVGYHRNGNIWFEKILEPNTGYIITNKYHLNGKPSLYMIEWIAGKDEYGGDDRRYLLEIHFFDTKEGFKRHIKYFDKEGKKIVRVIENFNGNEKEIYP